MNTFGKILMKTTAFFALLTILCGVIYPLAVTGIAQAAFGSQAKGLSLIHI